jgi:heme exporter protein B
MQTVFHLIKKDFTHEWRQRHSIGGVLLYVISTVFVIRLGFEFIPNVEVWNSLFWIVILFAAFQSMSKTFDIDRGGKSIYLYTLVSPKTYILSKLIYNGAIMLLVSIITYICYLFFIGESVHEDFNGGMFFVALIVGSLGLSAILTLIAAIASKTNNNLGLMAILGFPVVLPFLLTLIKFSSQAVKGGSWDTNLFLVWVLLAIVMIVVTLSYILFPYLWRD